jgi:5-deoxy-glucuronate isomerase
MVESGNLLVRPTDVSTLAISFTPEQVGWDHLGFKVRKLRATEKFPSNTEGNELAIVVLGGACSVKSFAGSWEKIGERSGVFDGLPCTLFLSIDTEYVVTADTDCEIAICYCAARQKFPAKLINTGDVKVEVRGGGSATRQINGILIPGDGIAERLMIVEVYTPSGNWSSFPPHKHDVHHPPEEVDLEEIYYYRINPPEGFAIQRVYSRDGSRDETLTVRNGELVLIPDGYHPVVAAHGYDVYYLNALAGSARSLAATLDPDLAWVTANWKSTDPRVPLVPPRRPV